MTIAAIGAIGPAQMEALGAPMVATDGVNFGDVVARGISGADSAIQTADQQLRAMAAGQEVAPHDLMISLEEARMHLTLLSEVRNKLVEGYQELSRMQL
ncbi:flagellar hook-basal body complex protein FliE [Xanthomonas arboricola]|uniref:flagellar hook-basal body complex protein FliE n=1 Tax=Xanthomonas arboricola TaxID=56448 RepID=UPI000375AA36|nr:flagellar hook-basal body complex protein FliE [Xanthomonas arboricola]KER81713.1 flagellar hook-basal body protein FliE [Xanthomonas arboricola pv. celebensis]MDN0240840.1 flagellar hook-basal body complex protein FliE [Xanthomonas arboricola pv. juglandis]MDN0253094.1 flagellar hook-basal body complex protein FliE [Xanthomonas arboricola pv. juglandis]MDN0257714.1 flagellar hook-basal body complex protein FliE [Xanthomonas arboricola pv. juglandis]MDN0261191.1 flagellar hook-basal body co